MPDDATMTAIGLRLRAAFSALIRELPATARASTSMAKYLGVSAATCQRLLEALNPQREPAQVPLRLPGPAALEQVLAGVRRRNAMVEPEARVQPETLGLARAGIEQYEAFIRTYARSQRSLLALMAGSSHAGQGFRTGADPALPPGGGPPSVVQRRALTLAASAATGELVDVKASVMLVRPDPQRSGALRVSSIVSYLGVKRRAFARVFTPGVVGAWWTRVDAAPPAGEAGTSGPSAVRWSLVRSMSSVDVETVMLAHDRGRMALVADFGRGAGDPATQGGDGAAANAWLGPADVTLHFSGHVLNDPRSDQRARLSLAVRVSQPTRLLVHDVLIHQSLAGVGTPAMGVYALSAEPGDVPGSSPDDLWHERFPEDTRLLLLGRMGGESARCAEHPGQVHAVSTLIEAEGVDARDYLGYRCLCQHPLWQTEYRVNFVPRSEGPMPDAAEGAA